MQSMMNKGKPTPAPPVAAELLPGPAKGSVHQSTYLPVEVNSSKTSSEVESEITSSSPAPGTLIHVVKLVVANEPQCNNINQDLLCTELFQNKVIVKF